VVAVCHSRISKQEHTQLPIVIGSELSVFVRRWKILGKKLSTTSSYRKQRISVMSEYRIVNAGKFIEVCHAEDNGVFIRIEDASTDELKYEMHLSYQDVDILVAHLYRAREKSLYNDLATCGGSLGLAQGLTQQKIR
jgi:hypothetical protein